MESDHKARSDDQPRSHFFDIFDQPAAETLYFRDQGLIIGSGEVESAHRHVTQRRLKLPGAWWNEDNLEPILALRCIRANGWWPEFWEQAA